MPSTVDSTLLVLENLIPTKNFGGKYCLITNLTVEKSHHSELKTCLVPNATQYRSQIATQVAELGCKPREFGPRSHILDRLTYFLPLQVGERQPLLVPLWVSFQNVPWESCAIHFAMYGHDQFQPHGSRPNDYIKIYLILCCWTVRLLGIFHLCKEHHDEYI